TLATTVASTFTVQGSGLSNASISTSALTTGKAPVSESQRIVMNVGTETGTFRLVVSVGSTVYQTAALSFTASASAIQTALNTALAAVSGTTTVTAATNNGQLRLDVTFGGALAAADLAAIRVLTEASPPMASGVFKLTYDGQTTDAITLSSNTTDQAASIQTALRAMSQIGAENVSVVYDSTSSASSARYLVTFSGERARSNVPQIMADFPGLAYATVDVGTKTPGIASHGETQRVRILTSGNTSSFTLSVVLNGATYTTASISTSAGKAEVQSALNTAIASASGATIMVTYWSGTELQLHFGGTLAGADVATMTGTATSSVTAAQLTQTVEGFHQDAVEPTSKTWFVNYAVDPVVVATGPTTSITLTLDGDRGELTEVSGRLSLTVSKFLHAEGNFAVLKSTSSLTIGADTSVTSVDLLTIGASDVSAFAGVNGGTENAMGLSLGAVDLGIVVATSQTDRSRQWTALKATAGNLGFVGIDGLTMSATDLSVDISRPDKNGQLVNFSASPLSVSTGPDSSMTLNYNSADGPILKASGTLNVDLFGFVSLNGTFAMNKSETQVNLADSNSTVLDVDLLTIGGKNVSAFAGVNSGSSDRMGLSLSGVEFGLALATSKTDSSRRWTALSATADSVEIVGLSNVTLSATDLALSVNRPDSQGTVLDFSQQMLSVKTGTETLNGETVDTSVVLDFEGSRGSLLEASGTLTLAVGGFFNVTGSLAVTKSSETLTLSDETSVDVDLLTIGGRGLSAFAGVNYNSASQTGLLLTNTEFALSLATDSRDTSRKWTTLQASVGSAALTGISGVTVLSTDLTVLINRPAADDTLVDYSASPLQVATGQTTSLVLNVDGGLGPVLKAT
ncbi:MAG: hypothetical protein WCK86_22730, partial [Planctomycetia bacterium]